MDLRRYFSDLKAKEAELDKEHPDGIVHVTSLFYRERNSTPGTTASATCHNAARVITDGTHRVATEEEIDEFYAAQKKELQKNLRAEQQKNQQYVVVTGGAKELLEPAEATVIPGRYGQKRASKDDKSAPAAE